MNLIEIIKTNKKIQIGLILVLVIAIVAYLTRKSWMKSYAQLHTETNFDNNTVTPTVYLQGDKLQLPAFDLKSVASNPYYMDIDVNGHTFSVLVVAQKGILATDSDFLEVAVFNKPLKELTSKDTLKNALLVGSLIDFDNKQVFDMAKYLANNTISEVPTGNFKLKN
jgi:hypothetical protein